MNLLQQLRKGSTPILILSVLQKEPTYGYQIMRALERQSEGYFDLTAASLYPTLHRLEKEELVKSSWQDGQGKRRRKYYTITDKGRQILREHSAEWRLFYHKLMAVISLNPPLNEGLSS